MTTQEAQAVLDKIVGQVFGFKNPFTLDQFIQKYAFDIRLPQQVTDATTGQVSWSQSVNPTKYITIDNARARNEVDDWVLPQRGLKTIEDILAAWNETNLTTSERQIESLNIAQSDNIYGAENIYRSQDINSAKNVLFSDGVHTSEFAAACQRSNNINFGIRVEDSRNVSNSFEVIWSNKVVNSFFINDCFDMYECMFCSHMASKQYCIANMQFEEAEYKQLKEMVVRWILTG